MLAKCLLKQPRFSRGVFKPGFNRLISISISDSIGNLQSERVADKPLSRPVLRAMLRESVRVEDSVTSKLVLQQCNQLGKEGIIEVEDYLMQAVKERDARSIDKVFAQAFEVKLPLTTSFCRQFVVQSINSFHWEAASSTLHYMIRAGVSIPDQSIFLVLAGLMSQRSSLVGILKLIKVIFESNRLEYLDQISFKKLNHYAMSFGGNQQLSNRSRTRDVERELLWEVMAMYLESRHLHPHKAQFTVAKLLVGLALAGRCDDIAVTFAKEALCALPKEEEEEEEFLGFELDRLSLIKAFTQADQLITRMYQVVTERSPRFAMVLMDSLWSDCREAAEGKLGKLKALEFYSTFWALAFRLKNIPVLRSGKSLLSSEVNEELLRPVKEIYAQLLSFNNDVTALSHEFSVKPGVPRRLMRVLCDEAGLRHKVLVPSINPGSISQRARLNQNYIFQVLKVSTSPTIIPLPSLHSIIDKDTNQTASLQRIDLYPMHWEGIKEIFQNPEFDEELLREILIKLALSMTLYPCLSWLLLPIEICQSRRIPVPRIVWTRAIKMCAQRNDVFGLVEILHAASLEQAASQLPDYRKKLESYISGDKEDAVDAPLLSLKEWNTSINLLAQGRRSILLDENYQEAFMEYIRLRHNAGVELDEFSLKILIKFLTATRRNEEMLQTLLFKRQRDLTARIDHVECCSVSKLLVYKARLHCDFHFSQPLFLHQSYLQLFPHTLEKINHDFSNLWLLNKPNAERFAKAWGAQHTPEGRKQMFDVTQTLVQDNLNKQAAMDEIALSALLGMVVHACYMRQLHDSQHKEAFDLLCLSYLLLSERAM